MVYTVVMKKCPCGKEIKQRATEANNDFKSRKSCSRACYIKAFKHRMKKHFECQERICKRCENTFTPLVANQIYCGSKENKKGCSYYIYYMKRPKGRSLRRLQFNKDKK